MKHSQKQDVIRHKTCTVPAMRATSSAKRSQVSRFWVTAWAWRHHRLNRLPCMWYLTYTQSSSSKLSIACWNTILMKPLKGKCKDTIQLHSIGDGKGIRQVTIEPDMAALDLVQLDPISRKLGDSEAVSG